MIEHIPELAACGVSSLKIEGRVKSEYYVATIAAAYRAAIDAYYDDPANYKFNPAWLDEVCKVSHRDYYTGFFFGIPPAGAQIYGSSSYIRDYDIVGIVEDYDEKTGIAKVAQRNRIFIGDEVEIMRPGKPFFMQKITEMTNEEHMPIEVANHAAMTLYIKTEQPVEKDAMIRKRAE